MQIFSSLILNLCWIKNKLLFLFRFHFQSIIYYVTYWKPLNPICPQTKTTLFSLILFVAALLKNKSSNECTAGRAEDGRKCNVQRHVENAVDGHSFPDLPLFLWRHASPGGLHKRSVACSCNLVAPNVDWTLLKQVNAVYSVQIEGVSSLCPLLISTDGKCFPCIYGH